MRPLLSLTMIVKDEAKTIREVLETAKPFVDRWTILDTGSTDGTQDIVKEVMASLPGDLFEEPFVDFATSRNRVLDLDARMSTDNTSRSLFQLSLSGDEYLRNGKELRAFLETATKDCFRLRVVIDENGFGSPRICRTGSPWRYQDDGLGIHEYFVNSIDPKAVAETIPIAFIDHIVSDPERRFANIWETHIPLLKAKLEENPEHGRALIYLAKSYEALFFGFGPGELITYAMKAMSLYLRRLALPFDSEVEKNFVRMRFLTDARTAGVFTDEEMFLRCKELKESDRHRPESALLFVHAATRVLPAPQIYTFACEAVNVAVAAKSIENESPVSTSCEWKAHLVAVSAAKKMFEKQPDWLSDSGKNWKDLMNEHVLAGLAAGGPKYYFDTVIGVEPQQAEIHASGI